MDEPESSSELYEPNDPEYLDEVPDPIRDDQGTCLNCGTRRWGKVLRMGPSDMARLCLGCGVYEAVYPL